jgi:hypothetical protein
VPGGLLSSGAVGLWALWAAVASLREGVGSRTAALIGLVLAIALLVAAGGAATGRASTWGAMTVVATFAGVAWFALWCRLLAVSEDLRTKY